MIRVRAEVQGDKILEISISGDFFINPPKTVLELEKNLVGCRLDENEIVSKVSGVYRKLKVESPGLSAEDFVEAIMKLKPLIEKSLGETKPYTRL